MFQKIRGLYGSLLPASEFAQKKVCVMPGVIDIVKNRCTAHFTRIVDDDVAKTQDTLRDACLDGDILNLA